MKSILLYLVCWALSFYSTASFVGIASTSYSSKNPCTSLAAKKESKKKAGGGGFGGAAMVPCPCGFEETYSRCCGKLHKDVTAYKSATAEQVVRARYSAYAKKLPEFLIATTHPLHKDFDTDLKRWKEQIKLNMFDNFDLPRCIIVEEDYKEGEEKAMVQFAAEMILKESGEVTGFMESSQFERAKTHGGWLYLNGTLESIPSELLEGLKKEE